MRKRKSNPLYYENVMTYCGKMNKRRAKLYKLHQAYAQVSSGSYALVNQKDIDIIRDSAINIENHDAKFSLDLMTIAQRARPNGSFIHLKVNEYKKLGLLSE